MQGSAFTERRLRGGPYVFGIELKLKLELELAPRAGAQVCCNGFTIWLYYMALLCSAIRGVSLQCSLLISFS